MSALIILCGTYLILNGFGALGIAAILTDLVALASVFVYGTSSNRAEREAQRKNNDTPKSKQTINSKNSKK